MTRRFRLTPEAAARFPDLASTTGTEELEPQATSGVVKVRWDVDLATWHRETDLEIAE